MSKSDTRRSGNIAARMAHWSAHHRKIAIFGWLAFCFAAFAFGTAIGTNKLTIAQAGVRESGRMDRLLDKEFKSPAGERVIIQSQSLDTRDSGFQVVISDVIKRLRTNRTLTNFKSPLEDSGLISKSISTEWPSLETRPESLSGDLKFVIA